MNISYQNNQNVLLLSLALCGWKYENVYSKMKRVPGVYKEIQNVLEKGSFDFHVFDDYFSHRNPYWFFRWVLKHDNVPGYKLLEDATEEELNYFKKFDASYLSLASQVDLKYFEDKVALPVSAEIEKYEKKIPALIDKTSLLLPHNKDINKIIIYPNYLAIIGSGFAIFDNGVLKIVAGPPKDPEDDLSDLLIHEYLHSVINPMTEKYYQDKTLETPEGIVDDFYRENHPKYWIVLNEYIIRALVGRILNSENHILREKDKRGFTKISEVYEIVCSYKNLKEDEKFRDMLIRINEVLLNTR